MSYPKTVAFTGYRPEKMPFTENLADPGYIRFRESLRVTLRLLLSRDYTRFVTGMAQGFDTWVAEDVLALRDAFPERGIILHCAVPFPTQAAMWEKADRIRYEGILARADETVTVTPHYNRGAYHARNRYMVDMAEVLVAAYDGKSGGTRYTVEYACGLGRQVLCIDPATGKRSVFTGFGGD